MLAPLPRIVRAPIELNDIRPDVQDVRLTAFSVSLQSASHRAANRNAAIQVRHLPPAYAQCWALDLVGVDAFYLPTEPAEIGLSFKHGDRLILMILAAEDAPTSVTIDSWQTLSDTIIRRREGDNGSVWRLYLIVETGHEDSRRAFRLTHVLKTGPQSGNEAALVLGDDLYMGSHGPISASTYLDVNRVERDILAPWNGPNRNTGIKMFDRPEPDKGWCLLAKNLAEPVSGFLTLAYYNEAEAILRLYLLNLSITPDASAYQLELTLEAGVDSNDPVQLEGAFFPLKPDPTGWSKVSVVIPTWSPETWTSIDVPFLYPMASNLPPAVSADSVHDASDFSPLYAARERSEQRNVGISITLTPYLKGKLQGSLDAHAVGQAVQQYGRSRSDTFEDLSKGVFEAVQTGIPLTKKLKEGLNAFKNDFIGNLTDPATGSTQPWAYPLLGLTTFAGPLAAVGAMITALDGLFGSEPEPLQLALELEIKGLLSGTLFTPLQPRKHWFYLPGRCNPSEPMTGGMQVYPNSAFEQRLPLYPYPLGLIGFARPLESHALSVTHAHTHDRTLHVLPGANLDRNPPRYWEGIYGDEVGRRLGSTTVDEPAALVFNPHVDVSVHAITTHDGTCDLLPIPNDLKWHQIDSDIDIVEFGDEWDGTHGSYLKVRGQGSSYTIQITLSPRWNVYDPDAAIGGGIVPGVPARGYEDGVLLRLQSLPSINGGSDAAIGEPVPVELVHAEDRSPFVGWIGSALPPTGSNGDNGPYEDVIHQINLGVTVHSTQSDRVYLRKRRIFGLASLFSTVLPYDRNSEIGHQLGTHHVISSTSIDREITKRLWDVQTATHSRSALHIGGIGPETRVYTDRDFTFSSVPDYLQDFLHIATANNDKFSRDAAFLTFRVNRPVEVLVGHDERFMQRAPYQRFPGWLTDDPGGPPGDLLHYQPWMNGDFLPVMVNGAVGYRLFLYRLSFPAGVVKLGGNHPDGPTSNFSMYSLFVRYQDA